MLGADLTAGEHAHVDQMLALLNDIDHAWPFNQTLLVDSECERVVIERLGDGWEGMRDDRAYLLWANGRLVEVEPDSQAIAQTARTTMPGLAMSECDRCRCIGVIGAAVVACPRNLVALALCGNCVETVEPELFLTGETR